MILDTEFLISLRASDAGAVELASELEANSVPTRLPTIVIQELYVDVGAGDNPTEVVRSYGSTRRKPRALARSQIATRFAGTPEVCDFWGRG